MTIATCDSPTTEIFVAVPREKARVRKTWPIVAVDADAE